MASVLVPYAPPNAHMLELHSVRQLFSSSEQSLDDEESTCRGDSRSMGVVGVVLMGSGLLDMSGSDDSESERMIVQGLITGGELTDSLSSLGYHPYQQPST